jgi:N-acetylglucosaminyldiphosphoundecaprenol N-acetyl-beta-D-mannosaminyltransferase
MRELRFRSFLHPNPSPNTNGPTQDQSAPMSHQVQPPLSGNLAHSIPVFRNPSDKQTELAEIRAQFAKESALNVAALRPVTVGDLYSHEESDSQVANYLEEVLASSGIVQPPETTCIWGLDYHAIDMEQTIDHLVKIMVARHPSYVVTANLNYAMLCSKNPRLAAFTQKSALTLCDGMPILWRSKFNAKKLPERVAGADLIYRLTERCANKKLRVYFYGAAEGVAEKAAAELKKLYPKLIIAGVQCPPFRACSSEEIRGQIARIKQAKPDLLLVALGQPKGEYWIEEHLEELAVPLTIQLGASFDFVAGNSIRAPRYLQMIGLEWLHRMFKDPFRLTPRYFFNLLFLVKAIRRELIEKLS